MYRSPLARVRLFILVLALTVSDMVISTAAFPSNPADGAVGQIFLPNVTKTLGGASGWTTPIIVQNTGESVTDVTLTFYRFSDGKLAQTVTLPGLKPGQSRAFDPRTDPKLPDDTQFSTVAQATSGQVAVAVIQNAGSSWMAYSGTQTGGSTVYLPNITRNLGGRDGWNTPFIVQNLGTKATTASVSFFNFADGTLAKRIDKVTLEPGRSQAFLTWAIDGLADDRQYAVVVQGPADSQLYAIVNETSGQMAMSYEGLLGGSEVVSLPNVLKYLGGVDHWSTPFIVQNVGAGTARFSIEFYSFESGRLVTVLPDQVLLPGRSLPVDVRFNPASLPAGSYSVVVRGQAGSKLGAVVNEVEQSAGMAMSYDGIGQSQAQVTAYLPILQKNVGSIGWVSPIIAQNLGNAATDMTLTLFNTNGDIAVQKLFPAIKPGAAAVYDPRFDRRLKDGTYSGLMQATMPISAVVNIAGKINGDYAMAFNGTAAPQTAVPTVAVVPAQVGPFTFNLKAGNDTDVYVESTLDAAAAALATTQADADVQQVQKDFARQFTGVPTIYIFATTESYTQGLQTLLGYTQAVATSTAKRSAAIFQPKTQLVLADWSLIGPRFPRSSLRHELTHLMNSQIVGTNPTMPAWFDEGLAMNEELTVAGSKYVGMLERYRTASMAASGTLIPLADLDSPLQWSRRPSPWSYYQYAEAQQAVEMLRADVGQAGVVRILELMGRGQTFAAAFETVTGKPYADFTAAFPARAKALAPSYPAIVAVEDSPIGPGITWIYFGFTPSTPVTLDIRSSITGGSYLEFTDVFGAGWGYLGPNWPAGTYNFVVNTGGKLVSVIARKV